MSDSEEPKIIVDEDWKSQVEKEKEQLRQQEGAPSAEAQENPGIPPATFHVLLATLGTQAMAMMGLLPNPEGDGQTQVHLPMARHLIDMIGVLDEKTKGNLTQEEAKMLHENLHQLRMAYLAVSQEGAGSDSNEATGTPPASSIELP